MHFSASAVALLALAAGTQAGVPHNEPQMHDNDMMEGQPSGMMTGSNPMMMMHSGNPTVFVTSTVPCHTCLHSSTPVPSKTPSPVKTPTPVKTPSPVKTSTPGETTGAGATGQPPSPAKSTSHPPPSPPKSGFVHSNPGSMVTAPQAGVIGIVMGVAYAALMLA